MALLAEDGQGSRRMSDRVSTCWQGSRGGKGAGAKARGRRRRGAVVPDDVGLPLQSFGAWHLQHGHVAHVSFRMGELNFELPLGFQFFGLFAFCLLGRLLRS